MGSNSSIPEASRDVAFSIDIYISFASYNNKEEHEQALAYFRRALKIFIAIDYEEGVGMVAINVGEIFKKKKVH